MKNSTISPQEENVLNSGKNEQPENQTIISSREYQGGIHALIRCNKSKKIN